MKIFGWFVLACAITSLCTRTTKTKDANGKVKLSFSVFEIIVIVYGILNLT